MFKVTQKNCVHLFACADRRHCADCRRAGTTALAAVHASRRPAGHGVVHAMHSDAAKEGTGSPAICGHLYGSIWVLPLRAAWRALPIVATEFMGALINVMVFAPRLHGAPGLLVLDALVVPTVIAGKASSPLMRFLHHALVSLPEYKLVASTLQVSHEYGPYNLSRMRAHGARARR